MTTEEIHRICEDYGITNYTINEDLSIDVNGNVSLYNSGLLKLPLKFRNVTGWFDCSDNDLNSLEGAPSYVGRHFDCSYSELTSLEGAPSSVGGFFYCYGNPLESLKGIPLNLKEEFITLPDNFTYSDYIAYYRDLKFKKLLK